jgi:putative peptidoglycan lipid II flippase
VKSPDKTDERGKLARSAGWVGLLTFASRILGLLRDAVMAAIFGKNSTDAFLAANTIPNVFRRLLAEGALTIAFIPVYTEYREKQGEAPAAEMLKNAVGATLLVLALVTALGMFFAPQLVWAFAAGYFDQTEKFALTVGLTRLMFPFLFCVGLTALAMGALNVHRHFTGPALAPVLLNVFVITGALLGPIVGQFWGIPPIYSMACGVVVGGVAQTLLQFPFLRQKRILVTPSFDLRHPGVKRVALLMVPSIFGLALYQLNVIISRQFCSFLGEGPLSYFYYAQRLIEFPSGVFAVAIATVAMPNLSRDAARGKIESVKETYRYALRLVFFVMLPATAGLAGLALPLTSVFFQRGVFDHDMATQTAITVVGFCFGLWASAGVKQTVPVFFALQDTKTPVKVSAVCLLVYLGAAFAMYRPWGTFGLALAICLSSTANFLILLWLLHRRLGDLQLKGVAISAAKSVAASVACGLGAWQVAALVDWSEGGRSAANYGYLLMAVATGVVLFVLVSALLRNAELRSLLEAFGRRRRGKKG